MSNIIKLKRRASGSPGAPSALKSGEVAVNEVDKILYYGLGDDGSGNATTILALAGEGAFLALALAQTITGNKTFTGTVDMTGSSSVTAPTVTGTDNSTKVATTAFIKALNYLVKNGAISAATKCKITYDANGLVTAGTDLIASDIPALTAAKISDFDTQVRTSRLDQMAAPTSAVGLGAQRITNLADPSAAQDAATQAYVLAQIASSMTGQDWKPSVRAASSGNLTLSGTQTVDGVALIAGDRILAKDQTTASANGIYVVAAGAWSRATDMDTSAEASPGATVIIDEGTVNGDTVWILTTNAPITLGTTALTFTQLPGSVAYVGTANRVTVTGHAIDIAATYVGQTSLTTLGTITTGTWQGTVIDGARGGLGVALSTLTDGGLLKRSGTAAATAVAGTDYLSPSSSIDGGTF